MRINHLIMLIHPAIYQKLAEDKPDVIRKENLGVFVKREKKCIELWLKGLSSVDKSVFVVQHCAEKFYEQAVKPLVGERNSCVTRCAKLLPNDPRPANGDENSKAVYQHKFHINVVNSIKKHISKYNLEVDPASVTSEIWGESFEGCASGYAGAIAHGLGLKKSPRMRFEMNVWDSKFLCGAKRWEVIPLAGSDIEVWLFELYDGTFAAIYQARLSEQWLDKRPIEVRLNPARMFVSTKTGYTVWPSRPWQKDDQDSWQPYTLTISDSYGIWIRTWRMDYDQFRQIITSATVGDQPEGYEDYVFGGDFWAGATKPNPRENNHVVAD